MTVEDRLQHMIGAQAFQIAILQTENEKLQAQLAEMEKQKMEDRATGGEA